MAGLARAVVAAALAASVTAMPLPTFETDAARVWPLSLGGSFASSSTGDVAILGNFAVAAIEQNNSLAMWDVRSGALLGTLATTPQAPFRLIAAGDRLWVGFRSETVAWVLRPSDAVPAPQPVALSAAITTGTFDASGNQVWLGLADGSMLNISADGSMVGPSMPLPSGLVAADMVASTASNLLYVAAGNQVLVYDRTMPVAQPPRWNMGAVNLASLAIDYQRARLLAVSAGDASAGVDSRFFVLNLFDGSSARASEGLSSSGCSWVTFDPAAGLAYAVCANNYAAASTAVGVELRVLDPYGSAGTWSRPNVAAAGGRGRPAWNAATNSLLLAIPFLASVPAGSTANLPPAAKNGETGQFAAVVAFRRSDIPSPTSSASASPGPLDWAKLYGERAPVPAGDYFTGFAGALFGTGIALAALGVCAFLVSRRRSASRKAHEEDSHAGAEAAVKDHAVAHAAHAATVKANPMAIV